MTKREKDGTIITGADAPPEPTQSEVKQATLDPALSDPHKTPGSGMFDDDEGSLSG
jgi:hypothetical protein